MSRVAFGLYCVLFVLAQPLAAGPPPAVTFTDEAATYLGGLNVNARSVSLADIDGDGDFDLLYQSANGARLLRNNLVETGTPDFTDITSTHWSSPTTDFSFWSAAWGDYDGDGHVDVFVGQRNGSGNRGDLMRNDGTGSFTDVSAATGLNDPGFHQNVGWSDIDNDGDLDLIIAMEGPNPNTDPRHEIYRQNADGSFTPIGAAAGIQVPYGTKAYGLAIGDYDMDGDFDLYVSTCIFGGEIRNNFFHNNLVETGELTFTDIAGDCDDEHPNPARHCGPGIDAGNGTQFFRNSYGAVFHDFDDDGDLDLFMVGADSQTSKIWRNNLMETGVPTFTDTDDLRGGPLLSNVGNDLNGARVIDYDNDGDLDLFFHDHGKSASPPIARLLFRNDGNWIFTDVTAEVGLASASVEGSYDSTWADFDHDGDLDLFATTDSRFPERLFVSNASTNGNGWLFVELIGPPGNRTAVGASVYATLNAGEAEERTLRRENNTNAGTFNQSDLPVHIGLGTASHVDTLRVVWPDGVESIREDIAANQRITIAYPVPLHGLAAQ